MGASLRNKHADLAHPNDRLPRANSQPPPPSQRTQAPRFASGLHALLASSDIDASASFYRRNIVLHIMPFLVPISRVPIRCAKQLAQSVEKCPATCQSSLRYIQQYTSQANVIECLFPFYGTHVLFTGLLQTGEEQAECLRTDQHLTLQ